MTALQQQFMGPYERWQMEKYNNILPGPDGLTDEELFESGIQELERMTDYMNEKGELQLLEKQREMVGM